jgi:hypothetical protein
VNRNTVRLLAAVAVAWLTGALGGLAAVPYAAFVFVFCGVLVLPFCVAFWDSDKLWKKYGLRPWPPPLTQSEATRRNYLGARALGELAMQRYRFPWLFAPVVLGLLAAITNLFGGFAATVASIDGVPVHATRVQLVRGNGGRDLECVLAGPDDRRIPGTMPASDGSVCDATEDVLVDPLGLVDPVRLADDPATVAGTDAVLLGLALLSCLPAARRG